MTGQPAGWQGIGGTSGASPLWAALLALTDGSRACSGAPVGYANPALYEAAGSAYAADFNDVTTGNNDFTGTNGGRYAAGPGYDPASGLGTPNAASLAAALCANTIRLTSPGAHTATVDQSVSLRLHATASSGEALTYAPRGCPPGLKLNASTGLITGRPTRPGRYTVRASAHDSQAQTAGTSFVWTVGALPAISRLSLTSDRRRTPAGLHRHRRQVRARPAHAPGHACRAVLTIATGRGVGVTTTARRPGAPALHRRRITRDGPDDQAAQDRAQRAHHPRRTQPAAPAADGWPTRRSTSARWSRSAWWTPRHAGHG